MSAPVSDAAQLAEQLERAIYDLGVEMILKRAGTINTKADAALVEEHKQRRLLLIEAALTAAEAKGRADMAREIAGEMRTEAEALDAAARRDGCYSGEALGVRAEAARIEAKR